MQENTAIRLKQVMRERNLRQVDVLRLAEPYCKQFGLKLTKSDMSQFLSGKVVPGQWKLSLLGRALNVSEAWLMGYDVPMERKEPAAHDEPQRNEFIQLFSQLTPEQRQIVIDVMKGFLGSPAPQSDLPE